MLDFSTVIVDTVLNSRIVRLTIKALKGVPKMFQFIYELCLEFVDLINIFPKPFNWILLVLLFSVFVKMVLTIISKIIELIPVGE